LGGQGRLNRRKPPAHDLVTNDLMGNARGKLSPFGAFRGFATKQDAAFEQFSGLAGFIWFGRPLLPLPVDFPLLSAHSLQT
jgi:hypothetical protein